MCVLPGTEIGFEADIAVEGQTLTCRVAKFRQVNMDNPYTHHDALELPDESLVLTHLVPGQKATILQLPAALGRVDHPITSKPRICSRVGTGRSRMALAIRVSFSERRK